MTHLDEYRLNAYLDGELDAAAQQAAAAHLAACAGCRAALAELQSVFFTLEAMTEVELTTDLSAPVLEAISPVAAPWLRPFLLAQLTAVIGMVIWLWPTVQGWLAETTVLARASFTLPHVSFWQQALQWGTAVLQQTQHIRPAIPLAANQWTALIVLAFALWLTGNQLLLKDNEQ